ncbi:sulfatase [uncultured Aquimarina sp.]|uniref:sulfatase family protein n=1 Tax=uncultured Aquimarina sp. TaxID=575652 RepID=UPI00261F4CCA|nr:sulfatase [uncultured Aquimarina sp.]
MHKSLIIILLICLSVSCNKDKKSNIELAEIPKKPNILFIMSDDHTSQAFGIYKSRLANLNPTPNLDKLAKEGIIFDNCFVNNSICTPSRAAILTGQHSQANGVLDLEGVLPMNKQYLPIEIKKLGYQTALIGKWHLTAKPNFDYYNILTHAHQQGTYFNPWLTETGMNFSLWQDEDYEGKQYKGHSTDIITDLTLDWLSEKRDPKKPFMLMYHLKAPHDSFEFAPRYKDYLRDIFIPEPESLYDNKKNGSVATRGKNDSLIHLIGSSVSKRNTIRNYVEILWEDRWMKNSNPEFDKSKYVNNNMTNRELTSATYQEYIKRYLRCVKGIDDNVARVIKFLKENDLYDNTIIVYTGDQGFMLGEHDYIDKRWMYEESMRMPFFVRYPESIKPNTRTDAIINNTDFAPTLIEMAGGIVPKKMQGHSFKKILETGKEPENWQQSTYYRYWMHMAHQHANPAHFGIRTKTHKLIFYYGKYWVDTDNPDAKWNKDSWGNDFTNHTPVAWELYDLEKDPKEMNNVYHNPSYKDIITELKTELKKKRVQLNEDDGNKYPHIQKIIDKHWND